MTSAERRIVRALRGLPGITDAQLAELLDLPEPSVRRTRRQLVKAGTVTRSNPGYDGPASWRLREAWEVPRTAPEAA